MPELPEVEALAAFLRENAVGRVLTRVDLAAVQAIKTFDPPLSALGGLEITGASRHGKFLDLDVSGLHLVVHLARAGGLAAAQLKKEKKTSMRVHGRTGLPCPVCGDTVREVSFADSSMQYCPTCQTGGKPLADRRLSRLLK